MNYGIKVSKKDVNVLDLDIKALTNTNKREIAHLLAQLAQPYILGAKTQIIRYQAAALSLESNPTSGVIECIHETSNLFEDLNCLLIYLRKCNKDHRDHVVWEDIRNHIRHAIRDEFDKDDTTKEIRAKRLGVDSRLQIEMGFDLDAVRVGQTLVKLNRIIRYLEWAENECRIILEKAEREGRIVKES